MDVSVTRFREHCLELLSQVESSGEEVEIIRDGKPVARLTPAVPRQAVHHRPWDTLRGSGVLMVDPEESMLDSSAFDALR